MYMPVPSQEPAVFSSCHWFMLVIFGFRYLFSNYKTCNYTELIELFHVFLSGPFISDNTVRAYSLLKATRLFIIVNFHNISTGWAIASLHSFYIC